MTIRWDQSSAMSALGESTEGVEIQVIKFGEQDWRYNGRYFATKEKAMAAAAKDNP